jgi:transcriptional regulator with XRE-family HTH domain
MFSRKTVPSIKTLSSICDAFNISLSEFFSEKDDSLPKDEIIIAEKYKKLSPEQKKAFLVLLDSVSRY